MEKTFDAAAREAAIFEAWESAGAFRAGANASRDETFSIMIPPPNVTGSLHMGHAFNNTLQDILVRWKRMQGFDVLWQPGQDHAGIATQMVVERELAKTNRRRSDFSRDEFVDLVWQQKDKSGDTIINQLKRLGASCDWDRNAFTMSGNFPEAVIKVFVDLYNKGLIYRGKRLVNWDPHFETAISDLEVENVEVAGHMWHFKYPLSNGASYEYVERDEDGNVTLSETRDYISIATTRPETMLGDGAVAVHPSDERYAPIVGKLCEIPVGPKEHRRLIPIIRDEYPDPDFGSGAVKITGAHDFNDYQVAKRGRIPMYALMDTKGQMRSDGRAYADEAEIAGRIARGEEDFDEAKIAAMNLVPDEYRGLDRFAAREAVVADITAEGLAVMVTDAEGNAVPLVENKPIMQPFGDRSKVVIEPMLTDQWFVDTAKIVKPALDAVKEGRVRILPESGEKVYYHWLENIEPWCISRQLWWGHQVPVWYGPDHWYGDDPHQEGHFPGFFEWRFCQPSEAEVIAEAKRVYSQETGRPWEIKIVADEVEAYHVLAQREQTGVLPLYRDPDVLDTWFSSGLWPIGTLGWPEETPELAKYFPTSVLITGQDILFFWVARMMMMQLAVVGEIPFHDVYLHGLVRDAKGKKMSKSTGNVIDPLVIIDEYGADALRFTNAAMASIGGMLKIDMQRIAGYRNFGTKLWNAARFAEMNDCTPDPAFDPKSARQTVNKWIIGETARVREAVDAALEQYRFNDAASALYAHVWGKVCDWYVELAKPLFQGEDEAGKAETRATMAWAIDQCLILLHPIMPFITEELWGGIAERSKMLIHADWPTYGVGDYVDDQADHEMNWVIALIEQVRSVRAELRVNAGAKIPMIQLELDEVAQRALTGNLAMIKRLARIDGLKQQPDAPKGAVTIALEGGTFCLPLEGLIDVAAEKARLGKALDKLTKEAGGLRGKLGNEKFLANAPAAVVATQRERLAAIEGETATLKSAQERVAAIG